MSADRRQIERRWRTEAVAVERRMGEQRRGTKIDRRFATDPILRRPARREEDHPC